MARTRCLLLFAAILVVAVAGWCVGRFWPRTTVHVRAQDSQANAVDVETLSSRLGLSFAPCDPTSTRVGIGRDRAVAIAREANPHVQAATGLAVGLGHLSSAPGGVVVSVLKEPRLVWIVAFQGLDLPASGAPGTPPRVAHEYDVVIDAATGETVMSFIYR